jgi:negative regulator of sigma E activity
MSNEQNDALRWQLQGLRREIQPETDLWPGIAARLAQAPQSASEQPKRISAHRFIPWAMAASVLLVVGMVWQVMPGSTQSNPQTSPLVLQQAVAMTFDYENALARMQETEAHPEVKQAFGELDRSAAQILTAIDRDPHAVFLLEQLRRTYARRLQLTQRVTMT